MKIMFSGLLAVSFCFLSIIAAAQNTNSNIATTKNANAPIDGAWRSANNNEFIMMNDGFFTSIAQDSTGKWAETYAGSYTIDNANSVTLKVFHSSFGYRTGYLHTIEYEVKGENLTINWYKKLIDSKSVDMTSKMPKGVKTHYVRVKQ